MKKVVIIGDSNQAFLLPLKIALLLGCPVFSGHEDKSNRGYCSSSSWPEVKKNIRDVALWSVDILWWYMGCYKGWY